MTTTALAAARRIAGFGLPGRADDSGGQGTVLDDSTWRELLGIVERHRLTGLLAANVAGGLAVSDRQRDEAADRDERWQGHGLTAERRLLAIVSALEDRGIDCRVIKGPALAHTLYDRPEHRVFGDLDIVVPGEAIPAAREALTSMLGAEDPLPELRPGFDAEFAKDVLLRLDGLDIDLHRTIAAGPFGLRVPVAELFEQPATFAIATTRVLTLGPEATVVQICCNAALGDVPPRLISLRDVAQAILGFDGSDATLVDITRRWRVEAPVRHAITAAWETFGLAPHPVADRLRGLPVSGFEHRLLRASTTTSRSYTRQLAAVAAVPGVRAKARYARAIVTPQRSYLDARGWERGDHLKRAWQRLVGGRRP